METLGVNYPEESVPPKIWRAIMLDLCGFPTTDYLIINLDRVAGKKASSYLQQRLVTSKYGIVVRTVSWEDGKRQPYYWLQSTDHESLSRLVNNLDNQFVMAFAPLAVPGKADGFTVGRCAILSDETQIIEYITDEIQPRALERLGRVGSERSGRIIKKPGQFFGTLSFSSKGVEILQAIRYYADRISLLKDLLAKQDSRGRDIEVCLEFTLNDSTGAIEFHDFDF